MERRVRLLQVFGDLYLHFGPRKWWPAETPFEVVVGAILTQAVSWQNVEKAIANLKRLDALTAVGLRTLADPPLEEAIRSTRYYRAKARKLRAFLEHLEAAGGDLERFLARPWPLLRRELLGVWGLGPETVDSILLYAGGHPVFVVDAYTQRIFVRLGILPEGLAYQAVQDWFMEALPASPELFNEYHALIVALGHHTCRAQKPLCSRCPLAASCRHGMTSSARGENRGGGGVHERENRQDSPGDPPALGGNRSPGTDEVGGGRRTGAPG